MTRLVPALVALALLGACSASSPAPAEDAGAMDAAHASDGAKDAGHTEGGAVADAADATDPSDASVAADAAPFACTPDPDAGFADREPNDLDERASPIAQEPLCGEVGGLGDDVDMFQGTPKAPVLSLRVRLRGPGVRASLWRGAEHIVDLTDGMDVEAPILGGKLHRLEARSIDGARRSYELWLRVGRESP